MGLLVDWLGIDCADPAGLARFWAEALDYKTLPGDDPDEAAIVPKSGQGTQLAFFRVPDEKSVKNRLHLDLRPEDQAAEVERILALGATKVDIGQGSPSWVVLADPEGNEFCILRSLTPEEKAKQAAEAAVRPGTEACPRPALNVEGCCRLTQAFLSVRARRAESVLCCARRWRRAGPGSPG